jgi:hypothetical protein
MSAEENVKLVEKKRQDSFLESVHFILVMRFRP